MLDSEGLGKTNNISNIFKFLQTTIMFHRNKTNKKLIRLLD